MKFYNQEQYIAAHLLPTDDPLEAYPRLNAEWKAYEKLLHRELKKSEKLRTLAGATPDYYAPGTPRTQWQRLRQELYDTQNGLCFWCARALGEHWHLDHHIPVARGGNNGRENYRALCITCNQKKGKLLPEEFVKVAIADLF